MKYLKNTTEFYIEEPTVLSLGKFDGIHRGHELLMEHLASKKEAGLAAVIFTFNIPPRKSVEQVEAKVLTTNEEKMHIFEQIGIDYLVECPFTREIMCMEPEDFIAKIVYQLHVKCFVVGSDFHFGHNRRGDYHMLKDLSDKYGYEVLVIDKMQEDKRDISSTFVREEIAKGNIEKANHLLGYHYFVTGEILHGRHLGSTKLGIPTINQIPPEEKLLPESGVYVTEVRLGDRSYRGVTNVGVKPTIEGKKHMGVETYIFDFNKNIYNKEIEVDLLYFKRPEMKFDSLESLSLQMHEDAEFAEAYAKEHFGYKY